MTEEEIKRQHKILMKQTTKTLGMSLNELRRLSSAEEIKEDMLFAHTVKNREAIIKEDKAMTAAGNEMYRKMQEKAEKTAAGTEAGGKLSFLQKCKNTVKAMVSAAIERFEKRHDENLSPSLSQRKKPVYFTALSKDKTL